MKRRFLCILLVLTMLPIQSFAVNSGLGNVAYSTVVSNKVVSGGYDTGLALEVQTMEGSYSGKSSAIYGAVLSANAFAAWIASSKLFPCVPTSTSTLPLQSCWL